jgi:pyruvate,water dikinase
MLLGGKGASLARLVAAGLPVPHGFCINTAAYHRFVAGHGVSAGLSRALAADPETAARQVTELFLRRDLPVEVAADIRAAYEAMGGGPVAVRSSAVAEDLPQASFAGQHDTFLDVRGEKGLLESVRRCWASLWTSRAIEYRARHAVPDHEVRMGVVVQEMVPAESAGMLFTADPVTGDPGRLVLNAAPGLGAALVSGEVDPEVLIVDRVSGRITKQRGDPLLGPEQVGDLVGLAVQVEAMYGQPVDIEWAVAAGRAHLLQARPITASGHQEWNDSLTGDYLWTSGNFGEAVPSVMTPCTWSLLRLYMPEAMASSPLAGHPPYGNIGGRPYFNLSVYLAVSSALGVGGLARNGLEQAFGRVPDGVAIPRIPMSRWQILRDQLPKTVRFVRRMIRYVGGAPELLAAVPQRCAAAQERSRAATTTATLAGLWRGEVAPLLRETSRMLAGARAGSATIINTGTVLRKLVGGTDADTLLTGVQMDGGQLANLGPLVGLEQLSRGEIDRATYLREWGHRCPDEFEVSVPRPAEDPRWLEDQLAGSPEDRAEPAELLARQERARAAAWQRLAQRHPRRIRALRRRVARAGRALRAREAARSEVVRVFWVLRTFMLRAGELTGHGEDLFFCTIDEILDLLDGRSASLPRVAARRAAYDRYRGLPPYPTFIRGQFDPARWAADPHRRSDVYDETGGAAPASATIIGLHGAAGVVEGSVRVLDSVDRGAELRDGEVLVTTVTNVGWTPLFPRLAAVVTDVGAPLSHAAIVARELGIPAVVGCGDATRRLHTGDRVRVDGARGTVETLEEP